MRIAVIGTGIAGLTAARELHGSHELTVFEASDWVGGHTHTLDVPTADGSTLAVDTGFIVFNEKTYPGFCGLLQELGVPWQASDMSFSVKCDRTGLEYNGTNLDKLFAQRSNLLRPSFWRMVKDILRFYREAEAVLDPAAQEETLGGYLERNGYGRAFIEQHMIPMGAAIWSTCPEEMLAFPLRFLVQFFHNHGFLQVDGRPQWLVVEGGSRSYVEPLTRPFRDRIRLRTPVHAVSREPDGRVRVRSADGGDEVFDRVVMATHSDTTQKLLADATPLEREVLGGFAYQPNEVVLHTDTSIMPRRRRAWASWNYHLTEPASELPTVTYWMNLLQGLDAQEEYLVTLNRSADIDPARVVASFVYDHPVYSMASVRSQERHAEIDGVNGVHFCGAYWRYGFHEDGLQSGLTAARRVEERAGMEAALA